MIEKVARALAIEHQKKEGFTSPNDGDWRNYRSDARKAIEAMRDLSAGFNSDERTMFNAAIDKVLED